MWSEISERKGMRFAWLSLHVTKESSSPVLGKNTMIYEQRIHFGIGNIFLLEAIFLFFFTDTFSGKSHAPHMAPAS